jgi:mono/diheme cytochrome c family protein
MVREVRRRYPLVIAVVAVLLLLGGAGVYYVTARGFSARDQPTLLETVIARQVRHMGVPRSASARANPVPDTPEAVRSGLQHFADHCAVCHANDGSGDTQIGRNLYPKAPDMRLKQTQDLSDGELFYIIENGVRLTGMPAWSTGSSDSEKASWMLVRFIRHLPSLTDEERKAMEEMNPRSPAEQDERRKEEEFLNGGEIPPVEPPPPAQHRHGG